VGAVGHEDEEDAPAVRRVAHELLETRDDARRRAAVAVAVLAAAEGAVALVDDDDDVADALDDAEDALEVGLGGPHPLRAEVLELDAGEPALLDEGVGDEGLAGAHRAGEEEAHRHAVFSALADVLGDALELALDLLDAADDGEIERRLDELDEPEALAL